MSEKSPTIFIVDDDPAVLTGLSRLLRSAALSVESFSSPQEFLDQHDPRAPGCLVLDIAMPGLNGLELQEALTKRGSTIPIIFLTGYGTVPDSVKAMKGGALDFLSKPVDEKDLLAAIRIAIEKDSLARLDRGEIEEIQERLSTLTPREREVMTHVVSGQLNKQIAFDLGTVEKTIKVHRARVMEKMKANSVAELVHLCERIGIVSDWPVAAGRIDDQ
jgi:FixJ family two-component response regulator